MKLTKMLSKIKNSKIALKYQKIHQIPFIPVIELAVGVILLAFLLGLIGLGKNYRIGLLFGLVNICTAFQIGHLISKRNLSKWWSLFFPIAFALTVLAYYANYNYFFSGIYLLVTLLGIAHQQNKIYR